jgi:hypothetical protein
MQYLFDSPISRRKLLSRLSLTGVGLYLPFLKMLEAQAQGTPAAKRVVIIALQHGWQRIHNTTHTKDPVAVNGVLKNNGTHAYSDDFTFTNAFAPLNAIKNKVAFLDGVRSGLAWGNAHDASYSHILTCTVPFGEGNSGEFPIPQGESVDNFLSRGLNANVLRLSSGYRSFGAQYHPLCWNQQSNELAFHTTPLNAFNSVIGALRQAASGAPTLVDPNAVKNKHVLAELKRDAQRIEGELTGESKQQFQRYMQLMESLYVKISEGSQVIGAANVPLPNRPVNGTNLENLDRFYELMVSAVSLGTHPITVLGIGQNNENAFPWVDANGTPRTGTTNGDFHHYVAHYGSPGSTSPLDANAVSGWAAWNLQKVVDFARRLDSITDSDGKTVLDNTMIVLVGEVGDGQHDLSHWGIPIIGGGWGNVVGNRYYDLPTFEPRNRQGFFWGSRDRAGTRQEFNFNYGPVVGQYSLADLWTTVANFAGFPIERWGYDVYNLGRFKLG